jgi:hypothetical protein
MQEIEILSILDVKGNIQSLRGPGNLGSLITW